MAAPIPAATVASPKGSVTPVSGVNSPAPAAAPTPASAKQEKVNAAAQAPIASSAPAGTPTKSYATRTVYVASPKAEAAPALTLQQQVEAQAKELASLRLENAKLKSQTAAASVIINNTKEVHGKLATAQTDLYASKVKAEALLLKGGKVDEGQKKEVVLSELQKQTSTLLANYKAQSEIFAAKLFAEDRKKELDTLEAFRKDSNNISVLLLQFNLVDWLAEAEKVAINLDAHATSISTLKGELDVLIKDPKAVTPAQVTAFEDRIAEAKKTRDGIVLADLMSRWSQAADRAAPPATAEFLAQLLVSEEERKQYAKDLDALYQQDTATCQAWRSWATTTSNNAWSTLFTAEAMLTSLKTAVSLANPLSYVQAELETLPTDAFKQRGTAAFDKTEHDKALAGFETKFKTLLAGKFAAAATLTATIAEHDKKIADEQKVSTSKAAEMQALYVNAQNPQVGAEQLWNSAHAVRLAQLTQTRDSLVALSEKLEKAAKTVGKTLDMLQDMSGNDGKVYTYALNMMTDIRSKTYREWVADPSKIPDLDKINWVVEQLKPLKDLIDSAPKKEEPVTPPPAKT